MAAQCVRYIPSIQDPDAFSCFVTKSTDKINHKFNCNSKCKTVKQLKNLGVDGIIIKLMLAKQLAFT